MSLFSRKRVPFRGTPKSDIPEGLWVKCDSCHQTVYRSDIEDNLQVCPACGHHYRIGAWKRLEITADAGSFVERHNTLNTADPLHFTVNEEDYGARVARAQSQSNLDEALLSGFVTLEGHNIVLGIMDPDFIMGSMGSVVGEKFCRMVDDAIDARQPLVVFTASGGARMQEGILALMQMAKTADAVRKLNEARIPYITVLTDPTTGGVLASFASLGDIVIAEPGAYIGFAGKRLIQGALNVRLPEGFQSAEYQMENGFLDAIVKRQDMRAFLGRLVRYLSPSNSHAGQCHDQT